MILTTFDILEPALSTIHPIWHPKTASELVLFITTFTRPDHGWLCWIELSSDQACVLFWIEAEERVSERVKMWRRGQKVKQACLVCCLACFAQPYRALPFQPYSVCWPPFSPHNTDPSLKNQTHTIPKQIDMITSLAPLKVPLTSQPTCWIITNEEDKNQKI